MPQNIILFNQSLILKNINCDKDITTDYAEAIDYTMSLASVYQGSNKLIAMKSNNKAVFDIKV